MKKAYKSLLTTGILFLANFGYSQVAVDSAYADNVQTCLKAEKVVAQVSVGPGSTGSYLEAKLPPGFNYSGLIGGSNTNGGTITYAGMVSGWHRFNVSATTNLATVRVAFNQFATCGAGTSSFTVRDSFRFYNGIAITDFVGAAFNGSAPDLSITSISHTPSPGTVGGASTRSFTVTNGGFGATSNFMIADHFPTGALSFVNGTFVIDPGGVNYPIPSGRISIGTDTVKIELTANDILQIGDNDTLFENGESFIIEYDIVPQNCGTSNVLASELLAVWRCPSSSNCSWYSIIAGISVAVPPPPSLQVLSPLRRLTNCYNGTSHYDTIRITNTGSGPATSIVAEVYASWYPNTFAPWSLGNLDTAGFYVRIGSNGTLVKPDMEVTGVMNNGGSSIGCNKTGLPGRVKVNVPYLDAGDTLFIITSLQYCTFDYGCDNITSTQNTAGIPGVEFDLDYKNGCGNIDYNGGNSIVVFGYRGPRAYITNNAPSAMGDGITYDLVQTLTNSNPARGLPFRSRSITEITINLPSVIVFDSSQTDLVYLTTEGGTKILPYAQTGPYTFRFNNPNATRGALHIRVKGLCDGVTCSDILQWGYTWKVNPDSTACSYFNQYFCKTFDFAWTSFCTNTCCPEGIQNLEYTINRINYGQPDNDGNRNPDASGVIDLSKINTKAVLGGDTLEFYYKGVIKTSMSHPSFENLYINLGSGPSSRYSLVSDSIWVKRAILGDTVFTMTPVNANNEHQHDLSFMPDFQQDDTIIIKLKLRFIINSNTGSTFFIDTRASHVANPTTGNVDFWSCGELADAYVSYRANGNVALPGQTKTTTGCNIEWMSWYIFAEVGSLNTGISDRFPFEYRPIVYPGQAVVVVPSGYEVTDVRFVNFLQHNTSNGNITYSTPYNGTTIPHTVTNDTLRFSMAGYFQSNGGLLQEPDEGYTGNVRVYFRPSCTAPNNTSQAVPTQLEKVNLVPYFGTNYQPGTNSYNTQGTLTNLQPQFITSSAQAIAPAYETSVNWPITHNNATTVPADNSWFYFISNSGKIDVDSVQISGVTSTPDANGFFRLGNIAGGTNASITVFSTQTACFFDSLTVYYGYGCGGYPTTFTPTTCSSPPIYLYVQPQPAAIQTTVTALSSTPSDPSNGSSPAYGNSRISMCESFPIEITIQSTTTGSILNVTEILNLPTNSGKIGLEYIADSGYIEYPIGTTPRKFGWRADSAILATVASGKMELHLNLIDSVNFDSLNGLLGTGSGTNATRTAIIRFKMKSNCDLISGDQWTATQVANSPCGNLATNSNEKVSGFDLNINGVTSPYTSLIDVVMDAAEVGCAGNLSTAITLTKIGNTASSATDSVFIRFPHLLQAGTINCIGAFCPSGPGPISYTTDSVAPYQVLKFPFPTGLTTGDTLRYEFNATTKSNSGCQQPAEIRADVIQQVSLLCNGTPCTNSIASLGNGSANLDIRRPVLSWTSFSGVYLEDSSDHTYSIRGDLVNSMTGAPISAADPILVEYYRDENNNGAYDKSTDLLLGSKSFAYNWASGDSRSLWAQITNGTTPDPSKGIFAVVDAGSSANNCNCQGAVVSPAVIGLPVEIIEFEVTSSGANAYLFWSTVSEINNNKFEILRRLESENTFNKVGEVLGAGNSNSLRTYSFEDLLPNTSGYVFYKLRQVDFDGDATYSDIRQITIDGENTKGKELYIFPNPTKSTIKIITGLETSLDYELVDALGNIVMKSTTRDSQPIDLSNLSHGMYFISVYQKGELVGKSSVVVH